MRLWEAATGQEWCRLHHDMRIRDLAFSSDGKFLASASSDGTPRLWHWQALACQRSNRNLTKAEWNQYLGGEPYRPTCPDLPVPEN